MNEFDKGIILAGGAGTRVSPITKCTSKQLIPVYDKPMVYYPLSTLMLSGIRDILLISSPEYAGSYEKLLGDGSQFGIKISYKAQASPEGLAQAFVLGRDFIGTSSVCLILGDNIFYGGQLGGRLEQARLRNSGATIFGYPVADPSAFGVAEVDKEGRVLSIAEKPQEPKSNLAVPGLYFFDNSVIERALAVEKSWRGEYEIVKVLESYLKEEQLMLTQLGRGYAWFDAGTFDGLLEVSNFVKAIQSRQGLKIACLEEIALAKGWLSQSDLQQVMSCQPDNTYWAYLEGLLSD